ncbi:hypothetical protein QFZ36_002242 [Pseudarthrobacter siccitolerans]|uniref:Plasmid pRiA4b Orf3-like domain-containing protein n=1 Tax=Pseudarthrobacter siccitolerans TaxID=861266 RepID=A0ABU0PL29_9MICC|nr:hypothetical protein [Pseudarthrobacter siccitolerans]
MDGARRGPLEDSGGFPGYEEVMDALVEPSHPDHAEYSAWVTDLTGSDAPFDPAFLDIPVACQGVGADQLITARASRKAIEKLRMTMRRR